MQLAMPETKIEKSEEMTEETFGIGDVAVILDLLRSKMYSNPVRTIVQEICSNARDAHREIGMGHVPFEIKLPTRIDPTFWVRDFGPGLTPERMANVFIKYGNSTKRSDNSQTGGFGLGAKSPWAYADQYLIESVTPENDGMVKRCYAAVIDESRCGKLIMMSKEETTEAQGVKVILAVRPTDVGDFEMWVKDRLCNFNWSNEPLPIIAGQPLFDWGNSKKPMFEGTSKGGKWSLDIGCDRIVEAIVDGIPYRVDQSSLKNLSPRLAVMFNRHLRMYFNVGEINVAATREALDYTDNTINKIKIRMAEVFENLGEIVSAKLTGAKNLWEANVQFNELRREFADLVKGVKWNDIPITGESFSVPGSVYNFDIQFKSNGECLTGKSENRVSFEKKAVLVVNDLDNKTPNRNRVRRILQDLKPTVERVIVVTFRKTSEDPNVAKTVEDNFAKFLVDSNWDKYEALNLSAFEPLKPPRVTITNADGKPRTMVRCRLLSTGGRGGYLNMWPEVKLRDISELEGHYVILREREAYLANGKHIPASQLSTLVHHLSTDDGKCVPIYGVMQNFTKHIHDDLVPLDNLIEESYDEALNSVEFAVDTERGEHDIQSVLSYNLADLLGRNKDRLGKELQAWIEVSEKAKKFQPLIRKVQFLAGLLVKEYKLKDAKVLEDTCRAAIEAYPLITSLTVESGYYGRSETYKPNTEAILKYLS